MEGPIKSQKPWIIRFFGKIYAAIRAYFAFIGILVTLGGVGWGYVFIKMLSEEDLPDGSPVTFEKGHPKRLKLVLDGPVTGKSPSMSDMLLKSFGQESHTISLPDLRTTLAKAKTDSRISGLYVVLQNLSATTADIVELRRIFSDFRFQGKRIHVVLNEASDWNYYLASVAQYITLNPTASLDMSGPSFTLVYFGEGLKKLGIQMEVVKAGKYKSAFEPFISNAPSEPTIEEYDSIRSKLLEHMVQTIAEGRSKEPSEVAQWFKQSLFTPEEALKKGLVDKLGYDSETNEEPFVKGQPVMAEAPSAPAEAAKPTENPDDSISYRAYASLAKGTPLSVPTVDSKDGLGLIEAYGEIAMHQDESFMGDDSGISPERLTKRLRWAGQSRYIKAVVLKIDSPGGSAVASDIIWNEVRHLATLKPVVVYMGNVAASGGYYIAAPASYIVSEPTTITGSIGVIGMLPKFKDFEEKYGVSFHLISGSDRKSLMHPGRLLSEEDRKALEESISSTYQVFLEKVASGRKLPLNQVSQLAEGRVYSGTEAKELGLVDDLGGYQMAIRQAKILGGLDPERLYPLHQFEDDDFDLKSCFANPLKCFGGANSIAPILSRLGYSSGLTQAYLQLNTQNSPKALETWVKSHQNKALMILPQMMIIN